MSALDLIRYSVLLGQSISYSDDFIRIINSSSQETHDDFYHHHEFSCIIYYFTFIILNYYGHEPLKHTILNNTNMFTRCRIHLVIEELPITPE